MTDLETTNAVATPPRWPGVVGVTGIVLAILMFIDKLDDLVIPLLWSPDDWRGLLDPGEAELVVGLMPPMTWMAPASLIGMALAAVLFVGSLRLRRRLRSGVDLCRRWSWLAIAWAGIEIAVAIWWLQVNAAALSSLAGGEWQAPALVGILAALVVMLAFPVFLLVWFSRPPVRAEYATWA